MDPAPLIRCQCLAQFRQGLARQLAVGDDDIAAFFYNGQLRRVLSDLSTCGTLELSQGRNQRRHDDSIPRADDSIRCRVHWGAFVHQLLDDQITVIGALDGFHRLAHDGGVRIT